MAERAVIDVMIRIINAIMAREKEKNQGFESLWLSSLTKDNDMINLDLIYKGVSDRKSFEPEKMEKILGVPVLKNAAKVILITGKVTGDLLPSQKNLDITDWLYQASLFLGIILVDHLVICGDNYLSFQEQRIMSLLRLSVKYVRTCNMNRYLIGEVKRVWQEIAAMRKAKNNHEWGWDDWLAEISNHFLKLGLSMRTINQYTNIPEAQEFFEKEV